jgi:hypothetical protein
MQINISSYTLRIVIKWMEGVWYRRQLELVVS